MVKHITLVGLGPGTFDQLSVGALRALQTAGQLILRTAVHPTVSALTDEGIGFETFDDLYESEQDFDTLYAKIVDRIIRASDNHVTYAVPGHPLVGEETVPRLLRAARLRDIQVDVIPSMSALESIYNALEIDPTQGLTVFDALDFSPAHVTPAIASVFLQLYNRLRAGDLKLALMERFPSDHPVTLVRAAGIEGEERLEVVPLHDLDSHAWIDHLTSLFVPGVGGDPSQVASGLERDDTPATEDAGTTVVYETLDCSHPLDELVDIMAQLRSPEGGCPWDLKQTHYTLKKYLVEEAYEVLEAIDQENPAKLCDELGDVLLQVAFHAQLASETDQFDIDDVIQAITEKMVRRHPHVFGDIDVTDTDEVLTNWETIKKQERQDQGRTTEQPGLLDAVSTQLPGLAYAEELQKKAAKVGFDWDDITDVFAKVVEEAQEVMEARESLTESEVEAEFGDLLFALVNLARHLKIHPELALRRSCQKFARRFRYIEQHAASQGKHLADMNLVEMDSLWDESKREEKES